ncbi:MAG: Smr domain-containing protein [Bacteroidetes bacterium OLB11]|nr:MAG: Smr domain-containing protein [Bacteroidetes bacterium OLB11]
MDLHIEKLNEHHKNLSSSEKLEIQLNEFEKQLDLAIALHQQSIVFIHGVGKGVLKNEIHKKLNLKIKLNIIKSYYNDYSNLHGFGATEVFIR